ncbi:MAG: hypothetical protein WC799_10050 [Desulfobacteraceae bacterium]|jgi:hypothetical protein
MRLLSIACVVWFIVSVFPSHTQAADYIDLGIEKADLYSQGTGTSGFVTIKPISVVVTVRNYSSIALDGFTLTPKIETYLDGTRLGPANGAFFFQPNYINSAPYTQRSVDLNGTLSFYADMTQPKAGHYLCVISFTVGGSISNMDSNSANNQKIIEFDVQQATAPKPDIAIENVQITKTGDTFQIGYVVRNIGMDPAQSVFDMKAKIYVIKGPTTIMTREDVFKQHDQPLAPGASVQMGPFVIRDSRTPTAGLSDGTYSTGVYTTQGCNYDANIYNNRVEMMYDFVGGSGQAAPAVIDLGIEKTDLYSQGTSSTGFVTIKPISLVVTVKNYSSIAIDGFTLTPKIETYYEGTLLGPANGAFFFQPNYINNAPNTQLSINLNGTYQFSADMSQPKAGHYRCVISYALGGSIASQDSNSANNQKTIEFDVRQETPPKPDIAIENVKITKTGDTFQIGYSVRNKGTDLAQSVFDMKTKIYVIKGPTTIMTREDVFMKHDQPLSPGASVQMGPYVIRDSRTPTAGLTDGTYNTGVYMTQGCYYDADIYNNRVETVYNFWVGGGDYSIDGVMESYRAGENVAVSYRCAVAQSGLKMGLFSVNESGINPKLGWQAVTGTSGTLQFKAPEQSGRFLFKMYGTNGQIAASSSVFSVIKSVATAAGTDGGDSVTSAADRNSALAGKADALNRVGALGLKGREQDANCGQNLTLKGISGYQVDECTEHFDEVVILLDEAPESSRNLRFKGEKTYVKYVWSKAGAAFPGDAQIKSAYTNAAKQAGAKVLVDRPRYTAFELTTSGKKSYASVETSNGGRTIVFISIVPVTNITTPKAVSTKDRLKTASLIKKRSLAMDTSDLKDRVQDKNCGNNLIFSGIDGYSMDECVKRVDDAVLLLDEDPESERNPRYKGEKTSARFAWPDEGGDSPSDIQIRRLYKNDAKTIGAKVLVDRPRYTAFELTRSGKKVYVSVEIFNDGRNINFMSIDPEKVE